MTKADPNMAKLSAMAKFPFCGGKKTSLIMSLKYPKTAKSYLKKTRVEISVVE